LQAHFLDLNQALVLKIRDLEQILRRGTFRSFDTFVAFEFVDARFDDSTVIDLPVILWMDLSHLLFESLFSWHKVSILEYLNGSLQSIDHSL